MLYLSKIINNIEVIKTTVMDATATKEKDIVGGDGGDSDEKM